MTVTRADQVATSPHLGEGHPDECRCQDLNQHADLGTPDDMATRAPELAALTRSRALGWRERTDHPRHNSHALSVHGW